MTMFVITHRTVDHRRLDFALCKLYLYKVDFLFNVQRLQISNL